MEIYSKTEKEVKRSHVYVVSPVVEALALGVVVCIWASVLGVSSKGIAVRNPLGDVVDILDGNVWSTYCTTISTRFEKSLNMLSSWLSVVSFSCVAIIFSSGSASGYSSAISSICTSTVVTIGIPEVSRVSVLYALPINKFKSVDLR